MWFWTIRIDRIADNDDGWYQLVGMCQRCKEADTDRGDVVSHTIYLTENKVGLFGLKYPLSHSFVFQKEFPNILYLSEFKNKGL